MPERSEGPAFCVRLAPPHAYEIFPRIAARFAPVADGTLLGRRCHVSCASRAKATASFASAGRPNSSEKCSLIPRGAICIAQHGHERRILRASAGDDHLVSSRFVSAVRANRGNTKRSDCVCNRSRRQAPLPLPPCRACWHRGRSEEIGPRIPGQIPRGPPSAEASAGRKGRAPILQPQHPARVPKPRLCRRGRSVCRKALPSPHQSPCCRDRYQMRSLGAATRPQESPSDSQCRQCSARCAPHSLVAIQKIIKKGNQRSALASSRHIRRTKIRDHRHTQPRRNHRAFAGLPRHRQFSSEKSLRALPGDRASVRDSPQGRASRDACARSLRPPPRTVRQEENSAAPDPRRGPIPHSSFPRLRAEPGQGRDIPREQEVVWRGTPPPACRQLAPMPH